MNFALLLLPDFALILCGYLVCRFTALNRGTWEQVDGLVYYFLFPVLLFRSIVQAPLDLGAASSLIGAGMLTGMSGIAMAYSLPYLPLLGRWIDRRQHAGAAQVGFRFNSFIAFALAERIAGQAGVLWIAVLIGFCVPMFNVAAVYPMTRHSETGLLRVIVRNPLIIATALGLAGNFAGLVIPASLEPVVARIGAASIALGLMAAGAGLQFRAIARERVLTVSLLSIRHLLTPLVALAMCRLFRLDPAQTASLLAFSALPCAASSYVLAARMGYDGGYVAGLVTLSTLLGMLSLPYALGVLR